MQVLALIFNNDPKLISYWEWLILQEQSNIDMVASITPILEEGYNAFKNCDRILTERPSYHKENCLNIIRYIPSLAITGLEDKIKDITDSNIAEKVMNEFMTFERHFNTYMILYKVKAVLGNVLYRCIHNIFYKIGDHMYDIDMHDRATNVIIAKHIVTLMKDQEFDHCITSESIDEIKLMRHKLFSSVKESKKEPEIKVTDAQLFSFLISIICRRPVY